MHYFKRLGLFFLLLLWANGAVATVATPATESLYQFERMWPNLPQPWYYSNIHDIAVDDSGFIWAVHLIDGIPKLAKYTANGIFIRSFRPFVTGQQAASQGLPGYSSDVFNGSQSILKIRNGFLYLLGNMNIQVDDQVNIVVGLFKFDLNINLVEFINLDREGLYSHFRNITDFLRDFEVTGEQIVLLANYQITGYPNYDPFEYRVHVYDSSGQQIKQQVFAPDSQSSFSEQWMNRVNVIDNTIWVQKGSGCFERLSMLLESMGEVCLNIDVLGANTSFILQDFEPILDNKQVVGGYALYGPVDGEYGQQFVAKLDSDLAIVQSTGILQAYFGYANRQPNRLLIRKNNRLLINGRKSMVSLATDGSNLIKYGASGFKKNQFPESRLNRIAANSSHIVVLKGDENTVEVYDYSGSLLHHFEIDLTAGLLRRSNNSSNIEEEELLKVSEEHIYVVQQLWYGTPNLVADVIVKYDFNGKRIALFEFEKAGFGIADISSFEVLANGQLNIGVNFRRGQESCINCGRNEIRYYEINSHGQVSDYELLYNPDSDPRGLVTNVAEGVFKRNGFLYVFADEWGGVIEQHTLEVFDNGKSIKRIENVPYANNIKAWQTQFMIIGGLDLTTVDLDGNIVNTGFPQYLTRGSLPGQFMHLNGFLHDVAITENHAMLYDAGNFRLQIFKKVDKLSNAKAIIVAGGGPYSGNSLWDATLMNANFAYRTLISQGYTKERIKYFAKENFDLDGNGELDDFAGDATNANLLSAISEWASDADNLVVYMIDHGGADAYRMGEHEILDVESLNSSLTTLEQSMSGGITIVYDACKSGSFIDELAKDNRTIITSATGDENAYFLSQGSVSFSSFFWQNVFNGLDLKGAFGNARDKIHSIEHLAQNPQISLNGQLLEGDLSALNNTTIGNGTIYQQSAPEITKVSEEQTITATNKATITATVGADDDGIGRVWGVIWPPNYIPPEGVTPILDLPNVDFVKTAEGQYSATYEQFNQVGTYQIAIYARDGYGNTSLPSATAVTVGSPLTRKALIIGGGQASDAYQVRINNNLHLAYTALRRQNFANESIYYIAAEATNTGVDGLNVVDNVQYGLSSWLGNNTSDLVVYVAGPGDLVEFSMSDGQLTSSLMGLWLETAQQRISGTLTVLLDTHQSGNWMPELAGKPEDKRIVMTSTNGQGVAYWLGGDTSSFGEHFWRQVTNGSSVREAFVFAKRAVRIRGVKQKPLMDDNGNSISNEKNDGLYARKYWFGSGLTTAGDKPNISAVSAPKDLNGEAVVDLFAEGITTTSAIVEVKAVVAYPHKKGEVAKTKVVLMQAVGNGRYEGRFNDAQALGGFYNVTFTASNADGYVSLPAQSYFVQTQGADVHENDNDKTRALTYNLNDDLPQWHTLHQNDVDWVKVHLGAEQAYEFIVDDSGDRLDVEICLFSDSVSNLPCMDADNASEGEVLSFTPAHDGVYYLKISHSANAQNNLGAGMSYTVDIKAIAAESSGYLSGYIHTTSGNPVDVVLISTSDDTKGLTLLNGSYLIAHKPGAYDLTFMVAGKTYIYPFDVKVAATTVLNISIDQQATGAPLINLPANIALTTTVNAPVVSTHEKITEFLKNAFATDANGNNLEVTHDAPAVFSAGTTKVTFTTKDNADVSVSASAYVWIDFIDVDKPVLVLNGQSEVSINERGTYIETGATANDSNDGDITTNIQITGSVNTGKDGIYKLTYYVADAAGNVALVNRIITVLDTDSDDDGIDNTWESANGLDPNNADDAAMDSDGDGLNNLAEFNAGTDPRSSDSDNDGFGDGVEVAHGLDANDPMDIWIDEDNDRLPLILEKLENRDETAKDNDVFSNKRLLVQQAYLDIQGRFATEGEITDWQNKTPVTLYSKLLEGGHFEQMGFVGRVYLAIMARSADIDGLKYHLKQLRNGLPRQQVVDFFVASTEFQTRYGDLTNEGFVNLVYQNVLGRAADEEGLVNWLKQLEQGSISRANMMLFFIESEEYIVKHDELMRYEVLSLLLTAQLPGKDNELRAILASDGYRKSLMANITAANDDSDNDGIPDGVEFVDGSDVNVKDNDINVNDPLFVKQMLRDMNGEVWSLSEINSQIAALAQASNRTAWVKQLMSDQRQAVSRLYWAFFLRRPEHKGLMYWIGRNEQDMSLIDIADFFAASDEFKARYNNLSNNEFVILVYQNLFNRLPDEDGLNYWKGLLAAESLTRGALMAFFSESQENLNNSQHRDEVVMLFNLLHRRAANDDEYLAWFNALNGGTDVGELIEAIVSSNEYQWRFY